MAQPGVSANRLELLQIADAVAREKGIDRMIVIHAMEEAVQKAAKSRYGNENDIRARIDTKTGDTELTRVMTVVEEVENEHTQISFKDARQIDKEIELGGEIIDQLPPFDYGRVSAQNAKQVIVQKVREAERERQYFDFKDRVGEVISGVVKRAEYGNVVVDLGKAEAIMRRNEAIPREMFQVRDRIRAFISDVRQEQRGPQIFLSRTKPEFMAKLFAQEVPEIYDGIVEIRSVARDAGSRAKIAVVSNDSSVDPVGACVGLRGSRVQAVVNELHGEKIDIIQWSPDAAGFIVNALAPAEVAKVVLDEDATRIEVVVPDEQLSLAIGRRGQNVRLASQLTGWDIDILTEKEESERRQAEFEERSQAFMDALNVDEVISQLLVSEGFSSVEEVAYVEAAEVIAIEGFDEDTAIEIQGRAKDYLEQQEAEQLAECKKMGVLEELRELDGMTLPMMIVLGENKIFNMKEFAYCDIDELAGWYEKIEGQRKHFEGLFERFKIGRDTAQTMIMTARLKAEIISQEDFDAIMNPPEEEEVVDEKATSSVPSAIKPAKPGEANIFKS
ncbi:MAG: transcription termination factor NusA [Hyphomicrobiaceae bacterium]|nr:transcription termination factor NusA [Hyphomicrobiaceae bacterium]